MFNFYQQANKFALPEWRYQNFEWYGQDNWKPNKRLTLDYGLRFYYLTPQWDTTLQASNFLPDQFDPNSAAKLYRPVCIGAYPCSGDARRGMDPTLVAQGVTPTAANTVEGRFIGRLTPGSNRSTAPTRQARGSTISCRDGNAFSLSPRIGVVYDLSRSGDDDRPRRLGDLLRSAAGQPGVRHDRERPGCAELATRFRHAPVTDVGWRRSVPDPLA